MEIHLKRFQPGKMQTNRVCLMIGKKGTGKSTLIEDIMWFQQHIPIGIVMSATEEANEAYKNMVPPMFIYKNFDADALERVINRQKKMKHLYKQNGNSLPFDHRAFTLIDDCMYDKKNFRSPLMRELFMNGRHWDLFVLVTVQYIMDVTPEVRTNTDYVFALKEGIRKNREKMWKEFFGVIPTFAMFDELFMEVTQDYRCLVLDTTASSSKIEDNVFWYKAARRPPFKLGAKWYWDYGNANSGTKDDNMAKDAEQLQQMHKRAVRVIYEQAEEPARREAPPPIQLPQQIIKRAPAPPQRQQQQQNVTSRHIPQQNNNNKPGPLQSGRESDFHINQNLTHRHATTTQRVPPPQRAAFFSPIHSGLDGFV